MPIDKIVRWLRGEHDDLHEFTDRLRDRAVRSPPGTRDKWIAELQERFDQFAAHFRQRMSKEEEDGYLKPVVDERPSLAAHVEVLKREHAELMRIIDSIERAVHRLSPKDNLLLRDCCKRIEDLLGWVERHEEHENHVVLHVFAQDTKADR